MKTLSQTQKDAIKLMDDKNLGAVVTKYGWTFPVHIRNNEDVAKEVIKVLSK